jgi:hypothetical protein
MRESEKKGGGTYIYSQDQGTLENDEKDENEVID